MFTDILLVCRKLHSFFWWILIWWRLHGITFNSFCRYGFEFLEHTYLYHVTRKDVKHNFSVYFYVIYLTMDTSLSWIISLLAFVPQLLLVLVFGVKYYKDLPFCCFVQTFAFVTFNKVCTSQVMKLFKWDPWDENAAHVKNVRFAEIIC